MGSETHTELYVLPLWCQSLQKAKEVTVEYLNLKLYFHPLRTPPPRPPHPIHHSDHPIPSATLLKVLYLQLLDGPPGMCGQRGCAVSLLHRWSLPNPEYYTLRYADGPQLYITEQVSTGTALT